MSAAGTRVTLSPPRLSTERSIEGLLRRRRSVRDYWPAALTAHEVAQWLWAAQGITGPQGLRATPSAGALYPLEVDLVSGDVDDLPPAIHRYRPDHHALALVEEGDRRRALAAAALGQECVGTGAAVISTRRGLRAYDRQVRRAGHSLRAPLYLMPVGRLP